MEDQEVLRKNKDMVHRVIGGETILLPVYKTSEEINCIYTLNPAAAWVWEMIDGKKSLSQIKKTALSEFKANPDQVEKRMGKLLRELKEIKAVV
jgi:hypothetical protein